MTEKVLSDMAPEKLMQISPETAKSLQVIRYRSIHEIDELLWDSINSKRDIFHTHRFIRSIEDAKVENGRFWYLLFYRDNSLVGTAVLSSFHVSLDLLMTGIGRRLVQDFRRWYPSFLMVEILFCGLPISIGKNTVTISDPLISDDVLDLLVREMEVIGHDCGIHFLSFKEFYHEELRMIDRLVHHHFLRLQSLPSMTLKIRWPDFPSFLEAMRHSYRRHIFRSLKKLGLSEPEILTNVPSQLTDKATLVLTIPSESNPYIFYNLYLKVMGRTSFRLEVLNEAFFEYLYQNLEHDMAVLSVVKGKQVLAAALLVFEKNNMVFLLAGLDYSDCQNDTYFNLIYGMVALAIRRGCTHLYLGQTAYWVKQRIGAEDQPTFFYIRAEHWFIQFLLKISRSLLFKKMKLPSLRVFRTDEGLGRAGKEKENHQLCAHGIFLRSSAQKMQS